MTRPTHNLLKWLTLCLLALVSHLTLVSAQVAPPEAPSAPAPEEPALPSQEAAALSQAVATLTQELDRANADLEAEREKVRALTTAGTSSARLDAKQYQELMSAISRGKPVASEVKTGGLTGLLIVNLLVSLALLVIVAILTFLQTRSGSAGGGSEQVLAYLRNLESQRAASLQALGQSIQDVGNRVTSVGQKVAGLEATLSLRQYAAAPLDPTPVPAGRNPACPSPPQQAPRDLTPAPAPTPEPPAPLEAEEEPEMDSVSLGQIYVGVLTNPNPGGSYEEAMIEQFKRELQRYGCSLEIVFMDENSRDFSVLYGAGQAPQNREKYLLVTAGSPQGEVFPLPRSKDQFRPDRIFDNPQNRIPYNIREIEPVLVIREGEHQWKIQQRGRIQ